MRAKNTLEYLGLWESLNNPDFKGVEFDPILRETGSNAFTMSPSRWVELTRAIGIMNKLGRDGGIYAQRDIAFKFASWVSERLLKLNQIAIHQMSVLENEIPDRKFIK